MPDNSILPARKADHIKINLQEDVSSSQSSGFDLYRFEHNALPEIDLGDIDTSLNLFGRRLSAPILISSMTGGTPEAFEINRKLALTAQKYRLSMGLGSQRAALEDADIEFTYQVREYAPDILLFANIGAVQLNYDYSIDHCLRAVEMVQADGLYLHLNSLQEALQPEGETRFSGLLSKIEFICRSLSVPVVVKEVGWGISGKVAKRLQEAGVRGIDVAGAGGTSWSQVEYFRINDNNRKKLADDFRDWGISTAECLEQIQRDAPGMLTFASGGIKNGQDIAKSIRLGASLVGVAGPYLRAAAASEEDLDQFSEYLIQGLRITMFATGSNSLEELKKTTLFKQGEHTCEI